MLDASIYLIGGMYEIMSITVSLVGDVVRLSGIEIITSTAEYKAGVSLIV